MDKSIWIHHYDWGGFFLLVILIGRQWIVLLIEFLLLKSFLNDFFKNIF
jgi:hypothetical protein